MFKKKIGLHLPNFINYSTLIIEHNWEDLYIQLKNRQMWTFDNTN